MGRVVHGARELLGRGDLLHAVQQGVAAATGLEGGHLVEYALALAYLQEHLPEVALYEAIGEPAGLRIGDEVRRLWRTSSSRPAS